MSVETKNLIFVFLIIVIAFAFRLPELSERPMHGDEAVNAVKFGYLLETGEYEYDPVEFHGPTLYYFSLPISWFSGAVSLEDLTEITVRIIPVIFGVGLILLLFLLKSFLGWNLLLLAAFMLAISPSFVFYSRYYIHEMLLVFFCYLFIFTFYRYIKSKKTLWILVSGISLGLLVSTKETWIILIVSLLISTVILIVPRKQYRDKLISFFKSLALKEIIIFFGVAAFTSLLFYSSFFTNADGVLNGLSAYTTYLDRAGNSQLHIHPWYMYLQWLVFFSDPEGGVWSEGMIALLALFAVVGLFRKKEDQSRTDIFLQYLVVFVLTTTFIYSLIPYKTPWNFLTFWFGFYIIAAKGMIYVYNYIINKGLRNIFLIASLIVVIHFGWQSYQLNYHYSHHISNPHVYAHPVDDVFLVRDKLEHLAAIHPDGYDVYIQVIAINNDYWPLPWYLRKFKRIGWWDKVDNTTSSAPVIITQPELLDNLTYRLYELPPPGKRDLYMPLFEDYMELRPGKELLGYIRKDYWDVLFQQDETVK